MGIVNRPKFLRDLPTSLRPPLMLGRTNLFLAGVASEAMVASGRFLPVATVSFGSEAVGHERPLLSGSSPS